MGTLTPDMTRTRTRMRLTKQQNKWWSGSRVRREALTLVELLVVVTIAGLLLALAGGLGGGFFQQMRISEEANRLLGRMALAQQAAMAENRPIQVRLLRMQDSGDDGWRGLQLWQREAGGRGHVARDALVRLPDGLVMSPGPVMSNLLSLPPRTPAAGEWTGVGDAVTGYVAFEFRPDGTTNLGPGDHDGIWFVTVLEERELERDGGPRHFATVLVDSVTGQVRAERR